LILTRLCSAQSDNDSLQNVKHNLHFQLTTVTQHKYPFTAPYTGTNSLTGKRETQSTMTATIFFGLKLWKNSALYFNPEIAGGSGVSSARGIADFTNGEAFRVGNPAPSIYAARLYVRQFINLSGTEENIAEAANQVYAKRPQKYISISFGKFSIADFFDNNSYSHDPRSQFFNWGLMSNGAWDYPANVRGYTWGGVIEYGSSKFKLRAASVMVPTEANGNTMDINFGKANSSVVELEIPANVVSSGGVLRLLAFYTQAHMGSYTLAVRQSPVDPDITSTRRYSRNKFGYALNVEQPLNEKAGIFFRASWNDGKNETWAFTEIDRSISAGLLTNGKSWNRKRDQLGIASVVSGLSTYHRNYLAAGGYGFIIGDGALSYGNEWVTELYYRANILHQNLFITPNYQFVLNPGYNTARGPAHIVSIRLHVEF
jgi:high affinity Mn2+ porin